MKVDIEFEIDSLEELDRVTQEIKKMVPSYTVKLEFDSEEIAKE